MTKEKLQYLKYNKKNKTQNAGGLRAHKQSEQEEYFFFFFFFIRKEKWKEMKTKKKNRNNKKNMNFPRPTTAPREMNIVETTLSSIFFSFNNKYRRINCWPNISYMKWGKKKIHGGKSEMSQADKTDSILLLQVF
jgi:hypothetical protein